MNLWNELSPTEHEDLPTRKAKRLKTPDGSHGVALNPNRNRKSKNEGINLSIPSDVHLTVRTSNKSLTRKHFRLITEVLLYEILIDGLDLYRYLMMVHLYQNLLGQKPSPFDISSNNPNELRLCLLMEVIMKDVSDKDFVPGEISGKVVLSDSLRNRIIEENLLMSYRTYMSRKVHWRPEAWLLIRPVFVDTLYERNGNSERYSSYCKGYGESHPSAHYKKSKPSAELDGEDPQIPEDFSLQDLRILLILNQLNLRQKKERKKD